LEPAREVGCDVDHILVGQRGRHSRHDRIVTRGLLGAGLRLEILELLDEIVGMLARQFRVCAAGTVAVCAVT